MSVILWGEVQLREFEVTDYPDGSCRESALGAKAGLMSGGVPAIVLVPVGIVGGGMVGNDVGENAAEWLLGPPGSPEDGVFGW